jgi:hypothetical protein
MIMSQNPAILSYQTAADTLYEPLKLSTQSTEKLSEAFVKVDR